MLGDDKWVVYSLEDVLDSNCEPSHVMLKDKRYGDLYILPAFREGKRIPFIYPEEMIGLCNELQKTSDYILIDCPSAFKDNFQNIVAEEY